jgi:Xaa-Pro aminopeptidase
MSFDEAEYRARTARAQALMAKHELAALLLTTEPDIRYFTGFLTRFWESPTRPWFLLLPVTGDPVAVIPAIGDALMRRTWISDIRTWRSPDLKDDGVTLLADTIRERVGDGSVGIPDGPETHLRMPLRDLRRLGRAVKLATDHGILRLLRMVKSEAEIARIRTACEIAGRAFDRVGEIAAPGVPMSRVFRYFQRLCLDEGADWVPYLAGGAGPLGYADVISPADDTPLALGDVLMLDTGLVHGGYFCDYDRNFSLGSPDPRAAGAHARLIDAITAAMEVARPGATAADLFCAMDHVLTGGTGGNEAGRYGHGLGMNLTEWPSLIPDDHTVLEPGMVLTLEPSVDTAGGSLLVHEENIVIRDGAPEPLTRFAAPDMPVI